MNISISLTKVLSRLSIEGKKIYWTFSLLILLFSKRFNQFIHKKVYKFKCCLWTNNIVHSGKVLFPLKASIKLKKERAQPKEYSAYYNVLKNNSLSTPSRLCTQVAKDHRITQHQQSKCLKMMKRPRSQQSQQSLKVFLEAEGNYFIILQKKVKYEKCSS